jgi:hypothetical protein
VAECSRTDGEEDCLEVTGAFWHIERTDGLMVLGDGGPECRKRSLSARTAQDDDYSEDAVDLGIALVLELERPTRWYTMFEAARRRSRRADFAGGGHCHRRADGLRMRKSEFLANFFENQVKEDDLIQAALENLAKGLQ